MSRRSARKLPRRLSAVPLFALILLLDRPLPVAAEATTPLDRARALHQAGRFEEALVRYRRYASTQAVADPAGAATAHNNACLILIEFGDNPAAHAECEAAVRLRRELGDEPRLARSLNNLGLALQHLGRFAEARAGFEEALAINRRLDEGESEAINLGNLGTLTIAAGDYGRALGLFAAAAAVADRNREEPWADEQRQIAHINEGVVLEKLGAFEEALDLYRGVLGEEERLDRRRRAALQVNLGVLYRNLGDPVKAVAAIREAFRTFEALGDNSALSNALLNLGLARHLNLEQLDLAENSYREALEFAVAAGDRTQEIQDLFYLGRLLLEQGRIDEAEQLFARCLATSDESGSAEGRWSALDGLGRIARARGNLPGALDLLEQAMAEIERVRAGLAGISPHPGYFGDKRPIFAAAVSVLAELDRRRPEVGYGARALEVVQRAKARELLDALGPGARPAEPLTADALGRKVGAGPLLEYFLAEGRLYLWIVRDGGVAMVDLGDAEPVLAAVARLHRSLARGRDPDPGLLADLSRRLLGPLDEPPAAATLRIAPDGRLRYLPFELLACPGAPGSQVVDHCAVSYLPSASALAWLEVRRPRAALTLAGFGNPTLPPELPETAPELSAAKLLVSRFHLEPLPAAERELAAIGRRLGGAQRLWLGEAATEEAFRRAVSGGAKVLHLATHTVVDERPARGAAVLLAPTAEEDGLAYPQEIADLEVRVDLTVLSSCRTAMGSAEDGRALSTLTGSLLGAGSSAVVATLWDVGDAASAAFMDQFYYQLSHGLAPAEALRRAKLRLRADPAWSEPGLWAAYVLIGEAGPVSRSGWVPGWAWLVAGLLVAAGVVLTFRQRRALSGSSTLPPRR